MDNILEDTDLARFGSELHETTHKLPASALMRKTGMLVLVAGFADLANRFIHFANHISLS